MSSSISIKCSEPISLEKWNKFCEQNNIVYSPRTIGREVYYDNEVEICFGEPNYKPLPRLPNDSIDFSKAMPNKTAKKIDVRTFWMGDLDAVLLVTKKILKRWKRIAEITDYDEEFTYGIKGAA